MDLKLYANIKDEIRNIIHAAENVAAWRVSARDALNAAKSLIAAEKKINPDASDIDTNALIKEIRAEIESEMEENAATEELYDPEDLYDPEEVTPAE